MPVAHATKNQGYCSNWACQHLRHTAEDGLFQWGGPGMKGMMVWHGMAPPWKGQQTQSQATLTPPSTKHRWCNSNHNHMPGLLWEFCSSCHYRQIYWSLQTRMVLVERALLVIICVMHYFCEKVFPCGFINDFQFPCLWKWRVTPRLLHFTSVGLRISKKVLFFSWENKNNGIHQF